jgi:hypothetical protein
MPPGERSVLVAHQPFLPDSGAWIQGVSGGFGVDSGGLKSKRISPIIKCLKHPYVLECLVQEESSHPSPDISNPFWNWNPFLATDGQEGVSSDQDWFVRSGGGWEVSSCNKHARKSGCLSFLKRALKSMLDLQLFCFAELVKEIWSLMFFECCSLMLIHCACSDFFFVPQYFFHLKIATQCPGGIR